MILSLVGTAFKTGYVFFSNCLARSFNNIFVTDWTLIRRIGHEWHILQRRDYRRIEIRASQCNWKSWQKIRQKEFQLQRNLADFGQGGQKPCLTKRNKHSWSILQRVRTIIGQASDPYPYNLLQYYLHRYLLPEKAKGGKQKTGVCRKTVCPKWEHTMAWDDITLDALWDKSLELTIWDHDRLGHNEILGGVRFNLGTGTPSNSTLFSTISILLLQVQAKAKM